MFSLTWHESELDRLAEFYVSIDAPSRVRLANAVEAPNERLKSNTMDEGESRSNGYRFTFIPFFSVAFRVNESKKIVDVTSLRRFGK